MNTINWGVLGTATIAVEKVIPAIQKGKYTHVTAIASRKLEKAQQVAREYKIPRAWDSYEDLLADSKISAVYIPLPNNLHVEWAIKALEAGKHVLCEKPLSISLAEAEKLLEASHHYPGLKIMEAFMYRFHPQWQMVKIMIQDGTIGEVSSINSFFSFYDDDPASIVNKKDLGGGSLMDIGCYSLSLSRFLFAAEPVNMSGYMDYDPRFRIDRLTSGILNFNAGSSTFTCATQLSEYQQVTIFGSSGLIKMDTPFIVEPDQSASIKILTDSEEREIIFDPCDQYTLQSDSFSEAVLKNTTVPIPLEDAVKNMRALESLVTSSSKRTEINLQIG